MKIAQIGLGKIGSCFAVALAEKEFEVIGVDINKEIIDRFKEYESPYYEPDLQELLTKNKSRLAFTENIVDAVQKTDMALIRVATPSLPNGGFSSEYVETAVAEICRAIPNDKSYYNVVVTSTVMPGTMEDVIKPLAEQMSQRKIGENLGLCYMPDQVALGSVIKNILNPCYVLIGESDENAGGILHRIFNAPAPNGFEVSDFFIFRMNFYNAEIAKIASNNYVSMKISFANTIAEICEKVPNGDASVVLDAIGTDKRIGKKFLKPGLGYGGPCFPRDQEAFIHYAKTKDVKPILAFATDKVNNNVVERIANRLIEIIEKESIKLMAVLGITYKTGTVYTTESHSMKIVEKVMRESTVDGFSVYDPARKFGLNNMAYDLLLSDTAEECLKDAKLVFIGTPWDEFKDIDKKLFKDKIVFDCFGILADKLENEEDVVYYRIGKNY